MMKQTNKSADRIMRMVSGNSKISYFRMKKVFRRAAIFCSVSLVLIGCEKDDSDSFDPSAPVTIGHFIPATGGGGTEILITGTNFSEDTSKIAVSLNGRSLAIVGASSNQIMVVVPKKAGSGPLTVSIADKTVQSAENFTYSYTRTVSTLAGTGTAGYQDGPGNVAMFSFSGQVWHRSMGITADDNLNVYVADPGNHCIRKIDSEGNVTTLAGNPNNPGYADGKGTAAQFSLPYDLDVDAEGNVYSVDPGNWDIRKISPDGTATTWAFAHQEPWSVAFDKKTGYVYYSSCTGAGNVYPVTEQGTSGDPVVTGLLYPAGIDFDADGNLYVCVHGSHMVNRYTAGTWQGSTIAGSGTAGYLNGPGTAAQFSYPWGLEVDTAGNIYVAGNGTWDGGAYNADQSIRQIAAGTYQVSTFAGSSVSGYTDAVGEAAAFRGPAGVAVDKNGTVYVLDKNNNCIRKIISE